MPVGLLKDIIVQIPRNAALMGLDVGTKTIGVAVCDPGQGMATPVTTIKRTKFTKDMQELAKIVRDFEIGGFVIGLPLNMDGSEGPRCQSVRDFAQEMAKRVEVVGSKPWIALWDERLSTEAVYDLVDKSVDIKVSKAKGRGIIDKLAAQYILQGALDSVKFRGP